MSTALYSILYCTGHWSLLNCTLGSNNMYYGSNNGSYGRRKRNANDDDSDGDVDSAEDGDSAENEGMARNYLINIFVLFFQIYSLCTTVILFLVWP